MSEEKEDLQILLNYAYFYLKFRPRTVKEVRDYLNKKTVRRHWSRDLVEQAIKHLEELELVNDKNFVKWFIAQRNTGKPKGRFVLKAELLRLGISKDLIDLHLQESPLDEEALALKALKTKWHRFKSLPSKERFEKAGNFLARRGFSFEAIRKIINIFETKI